MRNFKRWYVMLAIVPILMLFITNDAFGQSSKTTVEKIKSAESQKMSIGGVTLETPTQLRNATSKTVEQPAAYIPNPAADEAKRLNGLASKHVATHNLQFMTTGEYQSLSAEHKAKVETQGIIVTDLTPAAYLVQKGDIQ